VDLATGTFAPGLDPIPGRERGSLGQGILFQGPAVDQTVPEPSAFALIGLSLAAVGLMRQRRHRSSE
jgi:hypothetical protein